MAPITRLRLQGAAEGSQYSKLETNPEGRGVQVLSGLLRLLGTRKTSR